VFIFARARFGAKWKGTPQIGLAALEIVRGCRRGAGMEYWLPALPFKTTAYCVSDPNRLANGDCWSVVKGILLVVIISTVFAANKSAIANDLIPPKAPQSLYEVPSAYDWTGFYVGGHLGYAWGNSNWTESPAGGSGPSTSGSFTRLSLDYQFIANPAYNTDRGPVNAFAGRVHWQF
jgi:hypothetical protein